jgi:hypothetical protein
MAIFEKKRLTSHSAAESSFGVAEGSYSDVDIQAGGVKLDLAEQLLEDDTISQRMLDSNVYIEGLKSDTKISFHTKLRSTSVAAGDATASKTSADTETVGADLLLLATVMGGEDGNTGTTISGSDSSTTSINVTSSTGITAGSAVLITGEASPVLTSSGNVLTLKRALSSGPDSPTVCYASTSYYFTEDPSNSLQLKLYLDDTNAYQLLGCQGNVNFGNLNPGQAPTLNYELNAASWAVASGVTLANGTYPLANVFAPVPGKASKCYISTYGSTTATEVSLTSIDIKLNMGTDKHVGVGSVEGVQAWRRNSKAPTMELGITCSGQTLQTYLGDTQSQVKRWLHFQLGNTAGYTVLIEVPRFVISKMSEPVDVGAGRLGLKLQCKILEDGVTTSDLTRSAVKIHLL